MSRENNRNYRKKWLWKDDVFKSIDLSIQESNTSIDKQVITEKNKEDYLLHCVSYIDSIGTFFENMKII